MADRYRVTINGFKCHAESWDDPFQWDGKHDEIFLSVAVRRYDSIGNLLGQERTSESELMGDASLPNRIRVGSAPGGRGGIVTGDRFPNNLEPWKRGPEVNGPRVPPYTIWEGEMAEDQVVILTPTIWEWDFGTTAAERWLKWQVEADAKYGEKAKETFGTLFPVAKPFFGAISLGIQTIGSVQGLWGPVGRSERRPIGIQRDPNDPDGFRFADQSIALNSRSLEALIAQNDQGLGAGVVELHYRDDPALWGAYSIYVQVEKISGGNAPTILMQNDWRWCDRCQGLFYGGNQSASVCPEGGPHTAAAQSGSGDYSLAHNAPTAVNRQSGWRWCSKCQGLYWGLGVLASACPGGGTHVPANVSNSGDYSLPHNVNEDPSRQSNWRWCSKCMGLFYGGMQAASSCPASGTHSSPAVSGSGNYAIAHIPA